MLSLKNLAKVYRAADIETTALHEVNLNVAAGEFVAIMGPSGCGKSTLLNVIGMIDTPSQGEYWFDNRNIAAWRESQLSDLRKQNVGFIFQSFNLVDELTVFENVEIALLYHRDISARERRNRVRESLDAMNMSHRSRHRPQQLSGGQQQRTAIARAVVARPKLILADEPTGNLDSATGEEVMQLLTELNAAGTTIVMVTHSQPHAEYAHRVINVLDGKIVSEDVRRVA